MIKFKDEIVINATASSVFYFLTHIDSLYKEWHGKDHVFCSILFRSIDKVGSILHFFEWIGGFPLYLVAQTSKVEANRYLEFVPVFPFSLLKIGMGSFTMEKISVDKTRLIAYAEGGYNIPLLGSVLDFIARKIISFDAIRKHMKEEGDNMKVYLENQYPLNL